jgi:PadR family transcriptional regulator PadR
MNDPITGDALRGHIELLVLSLLEEGEAHGYELLQRIEARGCGLLSMREGTLYPVLYRLEEAGKIEGIWETGKSSRKGPRRRIYRLTRDGRRALGVQRNGWKNFVRVLGPIVEGAT